MFTVANVARMLCGPYIDGLVKDCSISIALPMALRLSCTNPSICEKVDTVIWDYCQCLSKVYLFCGYQHMATCIYHFCVCTLHSCCTGQTNWLRFYLFCFKVSFYIIPPLITYLLSNIQWHGTNIDPDWHQALIPINDGLYYQNGPTGTYSSKILIKYRNYHTKWNWKFHLQNGGFFYLQFKISNDQSKFVNRLLFIYLFMYSL